MISAALLKLLVEFTVPVMVRVSVSPDRIDGMSQKAPS